MQRFREWRESLKQVHAAVPPTTTEETTTHNQTQETAQIQDPYQRRAKSAFSPNRMDSFDRSASGTVLGATPASVASPTTATAGNGATLGSTLSFAELDRLRRERHSIFVSILSDPDQFAQFLRFLPALQQHELLFVCEINQLMEKSKQFEEAEIMVQAIKIANIFLRNADASTANTSNLTSTSTPASTSTAANADPDASVLQVQSIQPATRRHLQACIPLTLPPHLQLAGAPPPTATSSTPIGSYPKTDTKAILSLLEIARDQVEESLSKKSLHKFLDLLSTPDGGRSASISAMSDDPTLSLRWDYSFDDCYTAIASNLDETGGLSYVFRAFLLYLMEDKRHRILCFWADVHHALASVQDPDLDPAGSDLHHTLPPSASNNELHSKSTATMNNDISPLSAPVSGSPTCGFHSSRSLSQLYSLYAELEEAYHKFYPDSPLSGNSFLIHMGASMNTLVDDDEDVPSTPSSAPTSHILSPRGPYVHSNCSSIRSN